MFGLYQTGRVKELDFKGKEKGWKTRFHVAIAVGRKGEALELVRKIRAAPAATIEAARAAWTKRVEGLGAKFPALETDNAQLERLYARSLLHLLLNEWNVPEFELHPYYATGGINGGCVGNYLWNYGEVYRLWPMLSPDVAKAHLKKFLSLDLTKCFAFDPCSGKPFGPYYPVNQEKVLLAAYAYVTETGDRAFLSERLRDGTVLDRLQDGIVARTWRTDDGTVHVLVCNTLRTDVSGDLVVGGKTLPVSLPGMGVEFRAF